MSGSRGMLVKFLVFATIMSVLTVFLFFTFGQYRTGSTDGYSAVFTDASRLKSGDTVRVAGIRVGTVTDVSLQSDREVLVDFDADRGLKLTSGTKAAIRYLNLTGDRYLELADGPGSTRLLPPGSQIPVDRTQPALDLDLLLSGLKPVVQGLNPQDVNALTASLVQVFQGQGDTLDSLLSKTSSFTSTIADDNQTVQSLIDNLNTVLGTVAKNGDQFSGDDRPPREAHQRAVGRSRPDRHRDHLPGQRHRLADGSADPGPPAAGRCGGAAQPGGPKPAERQGLSRRSRYSARRATTASWHGSAPTAPSCSTTSARSPFASRTCRDEPRSSRS